MDNLEFLVLDVSWICLEKVPTFTKDRYDHFHGNPECLILDLFGAKGKSSKQLCKYSPKWWWKIVIFIFPWDRIRKKSQKN